MRQGKGTTAVGFKCKDGIIVATESRITSDFKVIHSETMEKFRELSSYSNIFCTMTGHAIAWDDTCLHLQKKIKEQERLLNGRTTPLFASRQMVRHLRRRMKDKKDKTYNKKVIFGSIICGWNQATMGFELYEVHLARGLACKQDCDKVVALGSGAPYIKNLLMHYIDRYDNMSTEEAADWALRLVFEATVRDKRSGGTVHVFYIHKNGYVEKHNLHPLDVCCRYYEPPYLPRNESKTILLIYKKSMTGTPIYGDDLMKLGPEGMIEAAHLVATTRDYHFHRVICKSELVASNILEFVKIAYPQEGHKTRVSTILDRFLRCQLIVDNKCVKLFVQRSSKELLREICDLPRGEEINDQLRPAIIRLLPN